MENLLNAVVSGEAETDNDRDRWLRKGFGDEATSEEGGKTSRIWVGSNYCSTKKKPPGKRPAVVIRSQLRELCRP